MTCRRPLNESIAWGAGAILAFLIAQLAGQFAKATRNGSCDFVRSLFDEG